MPFFMNSLYIAKIYMAAFSIYSQLNSFIFSNQLHIKLTRNYFTLTYPAMFFVVSCEAEGGINFWGGSQR